MRKNCTPGVVFAKALWVMILIFSLLMTAGCSRILPFLTEPGLPGETEAPETTPLPDNGPETIPLPDDGQAAASLNSLRQALVETPQVFAAAYFGYHDAVDPNAPVDAIAALQKAAPLLCGDLPFLLSIPQENIVGTAGELYCIVPGDTNATVAINHGIWDEAAQLFRYDEVIYRSESGEPVLLLCNGDGWQGDTQVTITDPDGRTVVWTPRLDANLCMDIPRNDDWEPLVYDFSPYAEALSMDYFEMMDAQWEQPSHNDLVGQTWCFRYDTSGQVTFHESTCTVVWSDGYSGEEHTYSNAPWELTYEEGFAVLTIDFGEFAGIHRYNLLLEREYRYLYIALDASTGLVSTGWEPLYRFLVNISTGPDPMGMVGTWELLWTEVEGERNTAAPRDKTIVITGTSQADLKITLTDAFFPQEGFAGKQLTVRSGKLYEGCGNNEWVADVDHVGLYSTYYSLTLLEDGTLLMQNYWEMEGMPMVSYCCFRKAG